MKLTLYPEDLTPEGDLKHPHNITKKDFKEKVQYVINSTLLFGGDVVYVTYPTGSIPSTSVQIN
jgi:hypothetical protein